MGPRSIAAGRRTRASGYSGSGGALEIGLARCAGRVRSSTWSPSPSRKRLASAASRRRRQATGDCSSPGPAIRRPTRSSPRPRGAKVWMLPVETRRGQASPARRRGASGSTVSTCASSTGGAPTRGASSSSTWISPLPRRACFVVLWPSSAARAFAPAPTALIDRLVAASDRNTAGVCRSLRDGVLAALGDLLRAFLARRRADAGSPARLIGVHQQSLTIIYRVLFLLFAESRMLVPAWHPVYRDGYSLDAARALAERPGPATGLWAMLQAISRLSHAGCHAGDLRVTPFNGRLFSPSATPLGESVPLADEPVRRVLLALSTTPRAGGRARIVYRDLDVEQLGAVYESVLDYVPAASPAPALVELRAGSGIRKTTATFYTPRSLTTYLVRRTLAPLVAGASPEQILSLRVVDPAMGSGAFLVAACRFLASAYESALIESGRALAGEIDEADRRAFRRAVAQRCLYGADLNPMAVQLARLSIWLATLAPERPLTFLDHRLVVGDSLVGASLDDLRRRPSPGRSRRASNGAERLPLFDEVAIGPALRAVLPARTQIEERPDDSLADVREKERLLASAGRAAVPARPLEGRARPLVRARLPGAVRHRPLRASSRRSPITCSRAVRRSARSRRSARCRRRAKRSRRLSPLHWSLEFPEVFYADDGTPLPRPGFDAVVGNPPWDMVRADEDGPAGRADARERARAPAALLARLRDLPRAGRGSRQPLPAVRRARASTRAGRRPGRASWCPGACSAIPAAPRCGVSCSTARRSTRSSASTTPIGSSPSIEACASWPFPRRAADRPAAWQRASASARRRCSIASRAAAQTRRTFRSRCRALSSSACPASRLPFPTFAAPTTSRCSTSSRAHGLPSHRRMAGTRSSAAS